MYRSGQRVVTQAIQKYLGSSYDVVKTVYDNLTLLLGLQNLADNTDKVVDVADNLDDVTSVADNLTDVSAVADNIVAITEVNDKVDDFNTKYLGSYASAPTVDGNGDPLVEGATYWNTTLNAMFVYTESQWVKPTGTGIVDVDTFTGDGSTASFPLDVSPASKTNTSVFIDGVYQEKDTYSVSTNLITFNTAPNDEASIEVIVNEITNFITGTQTETHTLTSGQTVVNLTNSPAFASFHIQGEDVDSQRLDLGTDYTLDLLTNTITLTNSYPENTVLKMLYGYDDDISVELAPLNQAILDHVNATENAHPASAIALAIKDVISPNPVSVQEAVDWTGIFVEEFRESGDSDSDVIIKALTYISNLPYTGTKLIFERGREYVYDNTHYLYEINKLHIDLNGATLKRADAADMTTTTVNVETVSGNITYEVVDASKFKVDDYVTAFTDNTDANTNRDARRVVGVNGNTITLSAPFFFSPSKTTLPIGTTIAKVFSAFSGRPSLNDSTTPLTQGINERIFITNGTIDGNSENQINNSWRYITEILLHSKKGLISKIDFKNTAGECIVGHGINVQKNTFTDMSGSCFHTSMNDAELGNSSSSWFSDNFCKNLNLAGNAVNGHSEGVVTFSWGAGRLFVVNNFMQDGNESFLGHFTASTGANADKNLIVQGNICLNFNSVIYGIDSPAEGIVITDNIFHNCGNNTTLWKSLITNNAVQIHSNILSGTTTGFQTTKTDALRVDAGNVNRDFSGVGEPQTYITKGSGSSATPNLENFNVEVIDSDSTALRAIIADGLAGTIHYKASGNVFGSAFSTFDPSINTLNVGTNEATGTVSIKAGIFVEKIKATANEVVISGESTTDRVYVNQYGVSLNNFEALIFGNNFTNGSWRFVFSGSDLLLQRREVGVWVTKQTFSA